MQVFSSIVSYIVGTRKCLFFGGHLTTHPRSWLISWRYLVMNRLAVLCGHDDCLARSNVWCGRNLRYQISHALRQVLWLQTRGKLTQEAIVTYLVKTVLTMTTGATNIGYLLTKQGLRFSKWAIFYVVEYSKSTSFWCIEKIQQSY